MPIRFLCPTCKTKQCAADHLAGRTLRCGGCKGTFVVPAASKAAATGKPPVVAPKPKPARGPAVIEGEWDFTDGGAPDEPRPTGGPPDEPRPGPDSESIFDS
jgi:hypothetical protein